jgi:hypothetical protein
MYPTLMLENAGDVLLFAECPLIEVYRDLSLILRALTEQMPLINKPPSLTKALTYWALLTTLLLD